MRITARSNTAVAVRATEQVGRQLAFATAVALNRTAEDFQGEQRTRMLRVFTARRRQWIERNVKIRNNERAKRDRLTTTVRMEAPGSGRSDILSKFEDGGRKRPVTGSRLAVPQEEVKRSTAGVIRRDARPRAFNFERMGGKKATAMHVYRGERRTWMIKNPDGSGGIYQRIGRKATKRRRGDGRRLASDLASRKIRDMNLRILYRFTPQAGIDKRLEFVETAQRTMRVRYVKNLNEAYARALETARR